MRIGSGVQSASEVFGKQQNNSKTYVAENEEFSQTSVKVYLKTDDMLFSGGNGTGLSFYIKYAEESTEDNPVVIAKGIDENGKEFEEKININDIDLRNASYVEMSALEAYYDVDRGNGLSSFPEETGHMGLNERCDLISSFEKVIQDMNKLGKYDLQMFYMRNMNTYLNLERQKKSIKLFIDSCWNENLYDVNLKGDFKMKKVKSLKALVLSLMLCLAMGTTAFASEVSTQGQAAPNANKAVEVSDCGDLDVVPAYDDAVALADTIQYDANRTITRSNSRSGVFNGNYYYTINNSSVTKLCLNVYMPNESGTDYLQGTITLVGNDGTSAPVQIANYSGDSWTLTFTGVKVGVRYHFHYELYSVGSSQVGYIASAAYAQ